MSVKHVDLFAEQQLRIRSNGRGFTKKRIKTWRNGEDFHDLQIGVEQEERGTSVVTTAKDE